MQCFIGISATNKFENHTFVIIHNNFTHVWLLWYEWEWTALVLEGNRSISIYYYDKHNNTWKLHAFTSRACWLQAISIQNNFFPLFITHEQLLLPITPWSIDLFHKWWFLHGNEARMLFNQNKKTSEQNRPQFGHLEEEVNSIFCEIKIRQTLLKVHL